MKSVMIQLCQVITQYAHQANEYVYLHHEVELHGVTHKGLYDLTFQ